MNSKSVLETFVGLILEQQKKTGNLVKARDFWQEAGYKSVGCADATLSVLVKKGIIERRGEGLYWVLEEKIPEKAMPPPPPPPAEEKKEIKRDPFIRSKFPIFLTRAENDAFIKLSAISRLIQGGGDRVAEEDINSLLAGRQRFIEKIVAIGILTLVARTEKKGNIFDLDADKYVEGLEPGMIKIIPDFTHKLSRLQKELAAAQGELTELTEKERADSGQLQKVDVSISKLEAEMAECVRRLAALKEELETLRVQRQEVADFRGERASKLKMLESHLKMVQAKIQVLEQLRELGPEAGDLLNGEEEGE